MQSFTSLLLDVKTRLGVTFNKAFDLVYNLFFTNPNNVLESEPAFLHILNIKSECILLSDIDNARFFRTYLPQGIGEDE